MGSGRAGCSGPPSQHHRIPAGADTCTSLHNIHIFSILIRNLPFRKLFCLDCIHLSWLVLTATESVKSGVTPALTIYGAWAGVMSGTRYHSSFLCCQKSLAFVGRRGAFPRAAKMAVEDSGVCPQEQDWLCAPSGFVLYL